MYIRISAFKASKDLGNSAIDATSVFRHRSSSQSIKETTASGKVADNQIIFFMIVRNLASMAIKAI